MQSAVFMQSYMCGAPERAALRHPATVTSILMDSASFMSDVYTWTPTTELIVNRVCSLAVLHVCNHLANVRCQGDIR